MTASRRCGSASACTPARWSPASSARHKFIYDVWGDTVNIASRLESHGLPDRIHVSAEVRDALAHRFAFEPRGTIMLKGKGETPAFFLIPPSVRAVRD